MMESEKSDGAARQQEAFSGDLKRGLQPRHLQLIALGGIIGSGYFVGSGYVVAKAGPGTIFAYLLGGLLVFLVMICLGELAAHLPTAGSFVTYANEFINPAVGCGVGWSYWSTWVTYVPSEMIAGGIIMHNFVPAVGAIWWTILFGVIITAINLAQVGLFGEMEFWLALIKIIAIIMFIFLGIKIYLFDMSITPPCSTGYLLSDGGLLPMGAWAVMLTMVIILVNFQGSEIIGLAAGESKDPERSIPAAVTAVSYRIIAIYVIPIVLLSVILPWREAGLSESVFAKALERYGYGWAGAAFSFVVLTAAISCSNSGLYATSRAVYSLAREGMAPQWLGKVSKAGVPYNAILASVAGCWIFVAAFALDRSKSVYTILLALSGFTGAIAWICICWAQLKFRRKLESLGFDPGKLKFRTPLFPWLTHFTIWMQLACLALVLLNPDLRISFYIGVPLLILPVVWYHFWGRKLRRIATSTTHESFMALVGSTSDKPHSTAAAEMGA
jgi:AAT family amino acid transporter